MPSLKRSASSEPSPRLSVNLTPDGAPAPDAPVPRTRLKRAKIVKGEDVEAILPPRTRTRSKGSVGPLPSTSSLKLEDVMFECQTSVKPPQAKAPKRQKSSSKPKAIKQSLEVAHPAPEQWRTTYETIKQMRARIIAPVDTMGCDQAQHQEKDPQSSRFATLISLMLSSQTKDVVTDAAVKNLRQAVGGALTVENILRAEDTAISGAIAKVGFWRRKTQYIKQAAQRLKDDFSSDVPKTVDELCSLPGVGPKMAFLTLQVAWKINVGIGVDVHVHRITNRLGWHKPPTKTPEETRLNLQSWLPRELHPDINHMLVGFGQTVCLPVGPRCDMCRAVSRHLRQALR